MNIEKYNKFENKFNYKLPEGAKYYKLSELYNSKNPDDFFAVRGFYINTKSKFGESATLISDGFGVNLPNHMTDTIKQMLLDVEVIEAVNNFEIGFKIREYYSKTYDKTCYDIVWVNIGESIDGEDMSF